MEEKEELGELECKILDFLCIIEYDHSRISVALSITFLAAFFLTA